MSYKRNTIYEARRQQARKRALSKRDGIPYRCVRLIASGAAYTSHIRHNTKQHYLGYYKHATDAALAYDRAVLMLFGSGRGGSRGGAFTNLELELLSPHITMTTKGEQTWQRACKRLEKEEGIQDATVPLPPPQASLI